LRDRQTDGRLERLHNNDNARSWTLISCLHDQVIIKQTSSKHRKDIEQTSSKYEACIKRSLHEANIKQTSSKHRANIEQLKHTSYMCILNAFAACLLDDCSRFTWSCKRDIMSKLF